MPDTETDLLHGTSLFLFFIGPWTYSTRTVVGDSYFASVGAVEELEKLNMGFIGVVKTSTIRFTISYL